MNHRRIIGNALAAFFAQGISMLVSLITTLIVPKILGIESFGYWQLFIFYASYVGFFHLGLNDGVYLLNGGLSRNEIDSENINGQFFVGIAFQSILAFLIVCFALAGPMDAERSFVLASIAPYMVAKMLRPIWAIFFSLLTRQGRGVLHAYWSASDSASLYFCY